MFMSNIFRIYLGWRSQALSRFVLHKRTSLFSKTKYFSLGGQARDKGIQKFKESLHQFKKVDRYYIVTDEKIN